MFFDILNRIRANFFSGIILFRGLQMCFFFCILLLVGDLNAQIGGVLPESKLEAYPIVKQERSPFSFGLSYNLISKEGVFRHKVSNKSDDSVYLENPRIQEGKSINSTSVPLIGLALDYVESNDSKMRLNLILNLMKSIRSSDLDSDVELKSITVFAPELNLLYFLSSDLSLYLGGNVGLIWNGDSLKGVMPNLGIQVGLRFSTPNLIFNFGPQIFHNTRNVNNGEGIWEERILIYSSRFSVNYLF